MFSGRLAAMLALQRRLTLGSARDRALVNDGCSEATGIVGSTPIRELSPAAPAQRPELSNEEQQLLQRAASGPVPSLAVDLSAFAEVPAIPVWRATAHRPRDRTLRQTFMIKRTEASEEVSAEP